MNIIKLINFPMFFAALKLGDKYFVNAESYKIMVSNGFELRTHISHNGIKKIYEVFPNEIETEIYLHQEYDSIDLMPEFVSNLRKMGLPVNYNYIYERHVDPVSGFQLTPEIGIHIDNLWQQAIQLHGNSIGKIVLENL